MKPLHFWQIHKKIYNREWLMLDYWTRKKILADTGSELASRFFKFVMELTSTEFDDEDSKLNSRFRFQYETR